MRLNIFKETEDYEEPHEEYELIGRTFESMYAGRCTIERSHKVKRGDMVSRVQRSENPFVTVSGVACKTCTKSLPRARQ